MNNKTSALITHRAQLLSCIHVLTIPKSEVDERFNGVYSMCVKCYCTATYDKFLPNGRDVAFGVAMFGQQNRRLSSPAFAERQMICAVAAIERLVSASTADTAGTVSSWHIGHMRLTARTRVRVPPISILYWINQLIFSPLALIAHTLPQWFDCPINITIRYTIWMIWFIYIM